MRFRQTPRNTDVISGLSALALMALGGAWMNPAFASAGAETRCDQSVDSPQLLNIPAENLTIKVVDHGAASSLAAGDSSVDDPIDDDDTAANPLDVRPRVEIMLRRIFDEPQLRAPETPQTEDVDARHAPLTVDKSNNGEENAATVEGSDSNAVTTALPGVTGDDLVRFKRQMYRTDI